MSAKILVSILLMFCGFNFSYATENEHFDWPNSQDIESHVHDSNFGRPHTFTDIPGLKGFLNPPLNQCRKSGRFKQRSRYFHPGCDLSTPKNAPVKAIAPGIVVERKADCRDNYAKENWKSGCSGDRGFGNILMIMHKKKDGTIWYSRYHHLGSIDARIGDRVELGQKIGGVGSTGVSFGYHLHFEILNASHIRSNPYNYYDEEKVCGPDIPPNIISSSDTMDDLSPIFLDDSSSTIIQDELSPIFSNR